MRHKFNNDTMHLERHTDVNFTDKQLKTALLTRKGFSVVFQPQFNTHTGSVVGAEALVRWKYTEQNVPPSQFISKINRLGLERELFDFVLDETQDLLNDLDLLELRCTIAVNASAVVLADKDLPWSIESRMKRNCLPGELLKIEVTEDISSPDLGVLAKQLNLIRSQGISISMDDFGVGQSTFERLVTLPFTELKIDRMFIREMTKCLPSRTVVESSLRLGKQLGMQVIAEGVEDVEQYKMLRTMGCSRAQGFALSLPLDKDTFIHALSSEFKNSLKKPCISS